MTTCLARLKDGGLATVDAARVAGILGVAGATVSAAVGRGTAVLWGDDPLGVRLEDLQTTLGEGPTVEVAGGAGPVLVPALADVPPQR